MPVPQLSLIHPTSNPFSRNASLAFADLGILREVVTTTAYDPSGKLAQLLERLPKFFKDQITQELERRTWATPSTVKMQIHPWREAVRVSLVKMGLSQKLGLGKHGPIDWVYTSLDRHAAAHHLAGLNAVYAYEDGAATTFAIAKQQGLLCLYDLPIAFYRTSRAIQFEEAQHFPELANALQSTQEPSWKLERKEFEIQSADHTFVPSSFVKQSLAEAGIPTSNVSVISFGAPIDYFTPKIKQDAIFRVLFVGRVGPRKGVHYLLQAWHELKLPNADLSLVGVNEFSDTWLSKYIDKVRYTRSIPHNLLNEHYSSASILVLPSLVEGLALVQLEAMACGIPIITTPNAGGDDIITDGVEGFVIPIRSITALKEKLEWCYQHPAELAEMGRAARRRAEQLTWERYRQQLSTQVIALLDSHCS